MTQKLKRKIIKVFAQIRIFKGRFFTFLTTIFACFFWANLCLFFRAFFAKICAHDKN